MDARTIKFHIMLSPLEKKMVDELATVTGWSRSQAFRTALTSYHKMQLNRMPTCADGRPCACPAMVAMEIQPQPPHAALHLPQATRS